MNFQPIIDYIENVLRKEDGVPGCDILICRKHEPLLRYQSGYCDYENTQPITAQNLYLMYSCTKPITATAGMQLVEAGKLQLDAPVSQYLPHFADAFLMVDGKKQKPAKVMTVRQLFTMSAGFSYDLAMPATKAVIEKNPNATTADIVNSFVDEPLKFEPGDHFNYSVCHDILAAVIEAASGERFSQYLKHHIFDPLGMTHTGFIPSAEQQNLLVAQYRSLGKNKLERVPLSNSFQLTPNYESGGAGLFSSVEDYSKFADAMSNQGIGSNGVQIIRPETIDLMRTEQLSAYTMDPRFGCAAGPGYGYGLGVRTLISQENGQRSSIGEFGWDGAAGSYVMMDPACGISIFFGMQVLSWPSLIGCGHAPIRDMTYEILGL